MEKPKLQRLESLDLLRGFDLFFLVGIEAIIHALHGAIKTPWYDKLMWNFDHVEWQGFSPWDLIMPLFMFMAGVAMPFALSKYLGSNKSSLYKRIIKRVVLLWIFGMMSQGNLLGLDPDRIFLFTNTLQAIAVGYLFSAILFLNTSIKTQIGVAVSLLLVYWGAMEFITFNGFGGGNYSPDHNLAEGVDRMVFGRFRDASQVIDGVVVFPDWYRYTWILSSLNFVVTVLSGVFAGHILKNNSFSQKKKTLLLFGIGAALVLTGWIWDLQMPVVKKIWTSSMVLVSSGYCFVLMGIFYYWIDYKGHGKNIKWLKVYGMNSIVAYMLAMVVQFGSVSNSLLHGFEQYLGAYFPALIAASNAAIIFFILWRLYKSNFFLRV
jgi:predicted acyltransferase